MEKEDLVLDKLNEVLVKLNKIEYDIECLKDNLEYLKKGNDNMTEHITFIESVYESIKNPFYFIMNKIKPIENIPEKPKTLTDN